MTSTSVASTVGGKRRGKAKVGAGWEQAEAEQEGGGA